MFPRKLAKLKGIPELFRVRKSKTTQIELSNVEKSKSKPENLFQFIIEIFFTNYIGNWSRGIPRPGESLRTDGIPQVEL